MSDAQNPQGAVPPASASLPGFKDREKTSLVPLLGRWEGLTAYGMGRYEILCEIRKGRGRSFLVLFGTKDYALHEKNELDAKLSGSFWKPGRYRAKVVLESLPGAPLEAEAWLGSTPQEASSPPELDRELDLAYKGRPGRHRLRFSLAGDRIRYAYTYLDPVHGPLEASGELVRTKRESL